MIVNKYSNECTICRISIVPADGFVFKDEKDRWVGVCQGVECVKRACPEELSSYKKLMAEKRVSDQEFDKEAVERAKKVGLFDYQIDGVKWITKQNSCLLADEMGLGKAQNVEALIYTPFGRKKIGDIKIGDQVIGSNGRSTNVIGVFPQGIKDLYRVTFNDGYSILVGLEHLFTVSSANKESDLRTKKKVTLSVKQMIDKNLVLTQKGVGHNKNKIYKFKTYFKTGHNNKWQIPIVDPICFDNNQKLSIEPYLLGLCLGDGCIGENSIRFAVHKDDFDELFQNIQISKGKTKNNIVTGYLKEDKIRDFKLENTRSHTKFIPDIYKYSSIENRISILQGLMDTDGHCIKSKKNIFMGTEYCTVSEQLADDVAEIVHSLGGIVKKSSKIGSYKKEDGTKVECKRAYRLNIKFSNGINPFRLKRKSQRYNHPKKYPVARYIKDIKFEKKGEAVCIRVDAPDHLYVTEHAIVTHNTAQILVSLNIEYGTLVIVPSHLKLNWRDETERWRPDLKITIMKDGKQFKYPEPGEIVITTYGLLPFWLDLPKGKRKNPNIMPEEREAMSQVVLIFDEVQALKNSKTIKSKRAIELRKMAHKTIGVTGTPIMNRELELWNMCRAIGVETIIFESFPRFLFLFGGRRGKYGYTFSGPNKDTPHILRRAMLRRLREEVNIQLPSKMYVEIQVDIPNKLRKKLDDVWEVYKNSSYYENDELPSFDQLSKEKEALARSKIPVLKQIVEDFESKDILPIVFSAHLAPVDELGKKKKWGVIKGNITPTQKQKIKDEFQSGKLKGLAATIKAAGTGLTLTKASHVIFNDLDWVPANNVQAEDRCARIGQTEESVVIYHLVADHPLDRHIRKLILKKMALAHAALDIDKDDVVEAKSDENETEKDFKDRIKAVEKKEQDLRRKAITSRLKHWPKSSKKISKKRAEELSAASERLALEDNDGRIVRLLKFAGLKTQSELQCLEALLEPYEKEYPGGFKKSLLRG